MDDRQSKHLDEAASKFADAVTESYRAVSDRSLEAQDRQAQLTRSFFESVVENLRARAERNRAASRELAEQTRKGQEASQVLAQESVNAYMDFLGSMFLRYRESAQIAEPPAAAPVEPSAGSPGEQTQSGTDGDLPLADYDSLNVRMISERLGDLSVEEIERLRSHEAANKNRSTLLRRFDARIESGA